MTFNKKSVTGLTHQQAAIDLKHQLNLYLERILKGDEPSSLWLTLIKNLRAFHEKLVEANSQALLTALLNYIESSDFKSILTDPILIDNNIIATLNALPFSITQTVDEHKYKCVDNGRLIHDIHRYQGIMSITVNKETHAFNEWIKVEIIDEAENGHYKVIDVMHDRSQEGDADSAMAAVAHLFGQHFSDPVTFAHLVPYLSQNAVLTTLSQDLLSLVRHTGLQLLNVSGVNSLQDITSMQGVLDNDVAIMPGFQLSQLKTFFDIADDNGPVITVRYIYDQYVLLDSESGTDPIPLLTPVQVEERFRCTLSENGDSATIKHESIRFSAVQDMPVSAEKSRNAPEIF